MGNSLISFFKRKILRINKDRWDYQYANNLWEGLKTEDELQRIYVAKDLLKKYHSDKNILEIGCGEGIFFQQIPTEQYKFYEGIDISSVAIQKAPLTKKSNFVAADMETYVPSHAPFATIVLNEVLYYSKNPEKLIARYLPFLEKEGIFLIGMFDKENSEKIWQNLQKKYTEVETSKIQHDSKVWTYKILKPK